MPCYAHSRGNCTKGKSCSFEHRPLTAEETAKRDKAEAEAKAAGTYAKWTKPASKQDASKTGNGDKKKKPFKKGGGKGAGGEKKNTPCTFYKKGECKLGDACRFSHE